MLNAHFSVMFLTQWIIFCSAAVSFMVADMFDKSIDIKELTRAARYGRTVGSCHTMKCDIVDNQLRTVGDYLGTFEEFITQIFNSISESLNFGKKRLMINKCGCYGHKLKTFGMLLKVYFLWIVVSYALRKVWNKKIKKKTTRICQKEFSKAD